MVTATAKKLFLKFDQVAAMTAATTTTPAQWTTAVAAKVAATVATAAKVAAVAALTVAAVVAPTIAAVVAPTIAVFLWWGDILMPRVQQRRQPCCLQHRIQKGEIKEKQSACELVAVFP